MKWIPRDSNHQADSLSRIIDFDDYSINYDVFHMLDCKRGPHTVDRFACSSQVTDIFKEGIWKETETFQDPYLQSLTSRLQTSVLSARAPATTKMYHRAFRKWMDFALSKLNISFLPAKPVHVAIYLQHVLESTNSSSSVDTAFYAIKWAYEIVGVASPTDNQVVSRVREAAKRILGAARLNRKEP